MASLLTQRVEAEETTARSRTLRNTAYREEIRISRPLRSAAPFLTGSILAGAMAVLLALYTPCYVLTVEGAQVGHVRDHEMVKQTVEQVEGQVSRILGEDYALELDLDYRLVMASKDDLLSYSRLSDALYSATPDIKQAYVLTVDGAYLGAAEDKAVLDLALQNLQEQYISEDTQEVYFANEARITRKYIPTQDAFFDGTQFMGAITQAVTAETAYEVQEGESLASVAQRHEMEPEALMALNPGLAQGDALEAGQSITVKKAVPLLSVCTVDQVSYTQVLDSPVREVEDNNLYVGDRKVTTQGIAGEELIRAEVLSVNGEAVQEDILLQEVITQPTETVVCVGTKERPVYYSTGSLQWPCSGSISSTFGYRSIFGGTSFHSGLDISNSNGTSIYAADSGVVTYVGYKGSYGNLVIVDHGNGWETYYAHCSQTLVSIGEGVEKGSQIATMGRTGRATGNHLHFEVRIGGEAVNPQGYLP